MDATADTPATAPTGSGGAKTSAAPSSDTTGATRITSSQSTSQTQAGACPYATAEKFATAPFKAARPSLSPEIIPTNPAAG